MRRSGDLERGLLLRVARVDVERSEVLRGPQGTLFGRNALGCVVNVVTRRPTDRFEASAEASAGNLGLQRYAAGVRGPVVPGQLYAGVSGLFRTRDGYLTADTTGTAGPRASAVGRTVGNEVMGYGQLRLECLPSARFSAALDVKGQDDDTAASRIFVANADDDVARRDGHVLAARVLGRMQVRRGPGDGEGALVTAVGFHLASVAASDE